MHAALDGVELGAEFVQRITISRELILIEGRATKPLEGDLLRQMLASHSEGDVVDFECEDAEGRNLSGVGTITRVEVETFSDRTLGFRIHMRPGVV